MPIETSSDGSLKYHLIAFDANGVERTDDPDGLMSQRVADALAQESVTDVFLFSHGWKGDVPSARDQYDAWTAAMAGRGPDIERMRQRRPGFHPLLVGLHWPSLPWGEEAFGPASFALTDKPVEDRVEQAAQRLTDTPAARDALRTLFAAASMNSTPASLSPEVRSAYAVLDRETGMGSKGEGAAPGDDREPFNPEAQYQAARSGPVAFGIGDRLGNLLSPLRNLSFWQMKDRARLFGERTPTPCSTSFWQPVPRRAFT